MFAGLTSRSCAGREIDDRDPLLLDDVADDAGVGLVGDEGAGALRRAGDEQDGELLAVRRPVRLRELSLDVRHAACRRAGVDVDHVDLLLARGRPASERNAIVWPSGDHAMPSSSMARPSVDAVTRAVSVDGAPIVRTVDRRRRRRRPTRPRPTRRGGHPARSPSRERADPIERVEQRRQSIVPAPGRPAPRTSGHAATRGGQSEQCEGSSDHYNRQP